MENREFFWCPPFFLANIQWRIIVLVDRWFRNYQHQQRKWHQQQRLLKKGNVFFQTIPNLWGHVTISAYSMPTKHLWNFNQKTGNPTVSWLVFSFFLTQIYEPYPLKRKLLCAKAARDFDPLYIPWQSWPCCLKTGSVSLWKLWNGTAVLKWIHHWI